MTKTRTQVTALLAATAVVLAVIVTVSPHTTIVATEVSGEIYRIDVLGAQPARIVPVSVVEEGPRWAPLTGDGSN